MVQRRPTKSVILDLNSEVCSETKLDNSKVATNSDVYRSDLTRTWVEDSNVIDTEAYDTKVVNSQIYQTELVASDITDCKVYRSMVHDSTVTGAQLRGSTVINCVIEADVQIGEAVLHDLHINQPMRIGTGVWDRVPRSFHVKTTELDFVVTESTWEHAYIGCVRKPIKTWIKGKDRFAKVAGWDKETADLVVHMMSEWLD